MKKTRIAWGLLAAGVVATGGIWMAACSEDSGTTPIPGGQDASKSDSSTTTDATTDTDSGGGDGGCVPTEDARAPSLHPNADAGAYCPFQPQDAGLPSNCNLDQRCCQFSASANKDSECIARGATCDPEVDAGGASWECDEPEDCVGDAGGAVCCLIARDVPQDDKTCHRYGSLVKGSVCRAQCQTGEFTICSRDSHCSIGACTPFSTKAKELGVCL